MSTIEEADLFVPLHDGTWIVDARMTILDAEEQFDITHSQEAITTHSADFFLIALERSHQRVCD